MRPFSCGWLLVGVGDQKISLMRGFGSDIQILTLETCEVRSLALHITVVLVQSTIVLGFGFQFLLLLCPSLQNEIPSSVGLWQLPRNAGCWGWSAHLRFKVKDAAPSWKDVCGVAPTGLLMLENGPHILVGFEF